jgi:hypothetical protein
METITESMQGKTLASAGFDSGVDSGERLPLAGADQRRYGSGVLPPSGVA